ncbi:MAG: NAD(P)/FAD-dependent oxidoreductase [Thermodesulfobacteriota bacterium]
MQHLILGSGIAGLQAARGILGVQPQARVSMLSREPDHPYSRPMIAQLLEGSVQPWQLDLGLPPEVELIPQDEALAVDASRRSVQTRQGRSLGYDRLLLASGADPRPISAPGLELENIFYMRDRSQVQSMLQALPGCSRALVLGGGLVGLKAAYSLLRQGLQVTMLIGSQYPLSQQVDPFTGSLVLDKLKQNGLEVKVGLEVTRFIGRDNKLIGAELSDGSQQECQLVVVGKGVDPAIGFLQGSGIKTDWGVLVDERLRTSVQDVYAAGDIIEHLDLARDTPRVNAIWPEAAEQGRIAGLNMAGQSLSYPGSLSRNVLRIFDLDVLSCGLVNPGPEQDCQVLEDYNPGQHTFRRLVLYSNRLLGAVCVNQIQQAGILMQLIRSRLQLQCRPKELLRTDFNPGMVYKT